MRRKITAMTNINELIAPVKKDGFVVQDHFMAGMITQCRISGLVFLLSRELSRPVQPIRFSTGPPVIAAVGLTLFLEIGNFA
jgi:hypothetical protein